MKLKPPPGLIRRPENLLGRLRKKFAALFTWLKRTDYARALFCAGIFLLYAWLLLTAKLTRFENIVSDYFFRERPAIRVDPSIAMIEIADDSIQALGRWPWARSYHAVMTYLLNEWGAKAIIYDMVFSEPSTDEDDNALEEALQKAPQVYLPVIAENGAWLSSLPRFTKHARGSGHITIHPDKDGTIRRIPSVQNFEGKSYPYLALQVAYDTLHASSSSDAAPLSSSDATPPSSSNATPPSSSNALVEDQGNMVINWAGKWEDTFEHYSYVDLIKSFEAVKKGEKPIVDPQKIKGKICMIGLTAAGLTDIKSSPVQANYPALGVLANILNQVLTNQYVHQASKKTNLLALWAVGLIALCLFARFHNVISPLLGLGLCAVWFFFCYQFFVTKGVILAVLQPILLTGSLFIFASIYTLVSTSEKMSSFFQLATRDGLTGLYVIRYFRNILKDTIEYAKKNQEPMSLVLIDIDNFKKINDTYGHQAGDMVLKGVAQTVQSCTRYKREEKVQDHVARYGGEELIILLKRSNLTDAAFKVAERIRKAVEESKFQWEDKVIPVTISLGVSTLHPKETDGEELIHRADEALYRAKKTGKNKVCLEDFGGKSEIASASKNEASQ